MWRLYLVSSIAAFRNGSCQLYQVVFSREGNDELPWSRDDLDLPGCDGLDAASGATGAAPTGGSPEGEH
jgi:hypothetical protein